MMHFENVSQTIPEPPLRGIVGSHERLGVESSVDEELFPLLSSLAAASGANRQRIEEQFTELARRYGPRALPALRIGILADDTDVSLRISRVLHESGLLVLKLKEVSEVAADISRSIERVQSGESTLSAISILRECKRLHNRASSISDVDAKMIALARDRLAEPIKGITQREIERGEQWLVHVEGRKSRWKDIASVLYTLHAFTVLAASDASYGTDERRMIAEEVIGELVLLSPEGVIIKAHELARAAAALGLEVSAAELMSRASRS